MALVIQIILSIVAWFRGWRGWALIPLAALLGISIVVAKLTRDLNVDMKMAGTFLIFADLVVIGILIWMIWKSRKPKVIDVRFKEVSVDREGEPKT